MDISSTAEDVDLQARSRAFGARPCNFQRKEPSLIHHVFRASRLEDLNRILCERCEVAQYGERCKRKVNDNYSNYRNFTMHDHQRATSLLQNDSTQVSTCRKVPGTGRLPRSTLFVSLRHFYTQFYSLSSPSDVKSCQLVWQLPATLVQNQWIWASQESQDALTDADGSHGDVDPEELQCVRKTIILIRNMLLCEWLHHISLCSISIYWTFIDQWPSSGKIASRSASFNGLARCRTMLTMAMNRMVVALPMQIRMPWTWRRGGVPTCDVFAAQFKRCIFFGDDLWMKWLTDGDENPCWLNCKWVILVMCECLAGLWGLPSPKSNFHTRSQPKRSSLSPVLGFGAKRHVSKVVKIQKDFGSTNLDSVGNHWKPILQFFLNTLTFAGF